MALWALIDTRNNRVCEVSAARFDVSPLLKWVAVPMGQSVEADKWTFDGGAFHPPPPSPVYRDRVEEIVQTLFGLVDDGIIPEAGLAGKLKDDLASRRGG